MKTPEELLAEFRETGSQEAFKALHENFIRRWVRIGGRLGLNWYEIDELENLAAWKLYSNPSCFDPLRDIPLSKFMDSVIRNLAMDIHRNNKQRKRRERPLTDSVPSQRQRKQAELREIIESVKSALPHRELETIRAWEENSSNLAKAAESLGVNYNTFYSRFQQAIAHARKLVQAM